MSQPIVAACIQMNTQSSMTDNIEQANALIHQAHAAGARFFALPENAFFMRGDDSIAPIDYRMNDHPGLLHCRALAKEL